MTVPAVLLGDEFAPLWRHVSAKLEDRGLDDRRPIPLPRGLPEVVFARLGDVLRVRYPTTRRRLDLEALDRGLGRYGSDLMALLEAAGCAPTGRQEARLADEGRRRSRDGALRRAAEEAFGTDPWVEAWCSSVRGTVPTADDADRAVAEVRRVLDCAADGVRSRAEVAGVVFGDTKALDGGDRRRRVRAAIAHRACGPTRDDAELWAASGLPGDLISSLVPTWALPLLGAAGVAAAVRAMTQVGQPVPLTAHTVRDLRISLPVGTTVYSVENPRLVEGAVQRGIARPMICTLGNPSRAVTGLVGTLVEAGATVRHHGDFDPDGIAITRRMVEHGATPWRMTAEDYTAAVDDAAASGVELRRLRGAVPPTPWDPELQHVMTEHGRAVDEERVMDELLADADREGRRSL